MQDYDRATIIGVRKLFYQTKTFAEIGQIIGITNREIHSIVRIRRYHVKRGRYFKYLLYRAGQMQISLEAMSKITGAKVAALRRVKRMLGLPTKRPYIWNKRIDDDIRQKMIKRYLDGETANEIATSFGYKTRKTVLDVLKKQGVLRRPSKKRTTYNRDAFKLIDSHEKAYILGFMFTDGYVVKDYWGVGLQLTEGDGYIMERMRPIFGESTTVIKINCDHKRKHGYNAKDMVRLTAYCKQIAEDLREWGVVRGKTHKLALLKPIPDKYIFSFVRGIIDGDGTVGVYQTGPCCYFSTMSEIFAHQFVKLVPNYKISVNRARQGIYRVNVCGGRTKIVEFLEMMYRYKGDFFLERKYAKVKSEIDQIFRCSSDLQPNDGIEAA